MNSFSGNVRLFHWTFTLGLHEPRPYGLVMIQLSKDYFFFHSAPRKASDTRRKSRHICLQILTVSHFS